MGQTGKEGVCWGGCALHFGDFSVTSSCVQNPCFMGLSLFKVFWSENRVERQLVS